MTGHTRYTWRHIYYAYTSKWQRWWFKTHWNNVNLNHLSNTNWSGLKWRMSTMLKGSDAYSLADQQQQPCWFSYQDIRISSVMICYVMSVMSSRQILFICNLMVNQFNSQPLWNFAAICVHDHNSHDKVPCCIMPKPVPKNNFCQYTNVMEI